MQRAASDAHFAKARLLAGALADFNGDWLAADEVTALERLRGERDTERFSIAVSGHQAMAEARRLYSRADFTVARPRFAEAARALEAAGTPFAAWARFYLAVCDHFAGRRDEASSRLAELWDDVPLDRYPSLAGRIRWSRGVIADLQGQTVRAEAEYRAAREIFQRLGERENTAMLDSLLAQVLPDLGRSDDAWRHLHAALGSRGWLHNRARLDGFLYDLTDALLREGLPEAARYAQSELARVTAQRGDAYGSCQALLARARIEAPSDAGRAAVTLGELKRRAADIADPELRREMLALACEVEAKTLLADDPAAARELVSLTIAQDTRAGNVLRLPELYRLRAAAAVRQGDLGAAEADLTTALTLLRTPELASSPEGPEALANTLVAVYDDLARLRAVSMNDARGAWKAAESGRSWALDELLGQSTGSPAAAGRTSLQDVQRRLPEGTQALYFAVLPDRLLVWLIEPGRFEMTETVLDPKEISAQIGRLRNAIGSGEANWQERAAALSGRVLGRLAGQLRPGSLLLVFPDKDLHAIPFPVLRDARGRFLFATHEVSVFPNATMFARGAAKRRPSALPQALVVGPPQLDPVAFPDLRRLPGAEEETRAVAALYPGVQLVTGEGATEGAVRRGLGGSEIIQISAHAVASQRLPWRSVLPLNMASDDSSDGGLYAQEVASLDLGRTGLVILSTCDSGRGSVRAGQGPTSLASAFLAAGSSAVVAALVRVPDRSSGTVVLDLHRRLLAGDSPAAALRHAELRAWRSGAHPASWAGYEVLGHAFQPLVAGPRPPV